MYICLSIFSAEFLVLGALAARDVDVFFFAFGYAGAFAFIALHQNIYTFYQPYFVSDYSIRYFVRG